MKRSSATETMELTSAASSSLPSQPSSGASASVSRARALSPTHSDQDRRDPELLGQPFDVAELLVDTAGEQHAGETGAHTLARHCQADPDLGVRRHRSPQIPRPAAQSSAGSVSASRPRSLNAWIEQGDLLLRQVVRGQLHEEFEGGIEQFLDAVHFVIQRHKSRVPDERDKSRRQRLEVRGILAGPACLGEMPRTPGNKNRILTKGSGLHWGKGRMVRQLIPSSGRRRR